MPSTSERMEHSVREEAYRLGIDLIGFSPMTEKTYLRDNCAQFLLHKGYKCAITVACTISKSACDLLLKQEDAGFLFYFTQHVKARAHQLEQAAHQLCVYIERNGYRAFLVPGLGTGYHDNGCRTIVSHITQARLAGMGTMGDSGMLLTKQFGPRVRLATILTDCQLPAPQTLPDNICRHCGLCVKICPSGSISGRHFDVTQPELYYTDRALCAAHRDENRKKYGSRFCNLCMAICPVGGSGNVCPENSPECI